MGRWEPDARGRLARAALVLSAEHGYDATTVAQVAESAGVTERTFYRHFADKADAVFPDNTQLLERLAEAATRSLTAHDDPAAAAFDAVRELAAIASEEPERILLMARVVPTVPALAGRDLVRQQQIVDTVSQVLQDHDVPRRPARLAAEGALGVWRVALAEWAENPEGPPLVDIVTSAADVARTSPSA